MFNSFSSDALQSGGVEPVMRSWSRSLTPQVIPPPPSLQMFISFSFNALQSGVCSHQHEVLGQVFDPTGDTPNPPADVYFTFV